MFLMILDKRCIVRQQPSMRNAKKALALRGSRLVEGPAFAHWLTKMSLASPEVDYVWGSGALDEPAK